MFHPHLTSPVEGEELLKIVKGEESCPLAPGGRETERGGQRSHGSGDATFHYVVAFWYNVERHGGILEFILAPACLAGRGFFATVGKSI
jgi:hypothetical protein